MKLLNQVFNWKHNWQRSLLVLGLMVLTTLLLATPASATGIYQMPQLTAGDRTWVIDQAEVLSPITESKISGALEDLAQHTGNEVRFVTIRRLDYGETPASFAKGLFEKWFSTEEAQANQTLLLIDSLSNRTAIITGGQVKTLMADNIADSVANETLVAPLREGEKYNQAFLDASDRLVAILSGQPDPGAPQVAAANLESTFTKAEETDTNNATIWVVGLLLAATVIPMLTYYLYVK